MEQGLKDYRAMLVQADERSQEQYDRTVIALSGGALGISLAFVDNIIGEKPIDSDGLLLAAWFSWTTSLLVVLSSYYLSRRALRQAIQQVDNGTIRQQKPGGMFSVLTMIANAASAILFIVGATTMAFFVWANI